MFCHLETLCTEEALRQLQKRGVSTMATMREFFFRQFAVGQPEKVKKREDFYLAGTPNANGEVFPPRCNMEDKLNALEKEREYLLEMCPKDKRDEYEAMIGPIMCDGGSEIEIDASIVVPFLADGIMGDEKSAAWCHGVRDKVVRLTG
jgi:hypothetical protein